MPEPRRNVELKARCADLERAAAAAAAIGARRVRVERQRDTFFFVSHGRLKLRERAWREEQGGEDRSGAELIAYARDDRPEARESRYTVVPVAAPELLAAALASTLGVRGAVVKRRALWMWQGVRIHLDAVEGLGAFVEFEAVIGPEMSDAQGHAHLARLREALALDDASLVPRAYADLLGL